MAAEQNGAWPIYVQDRMEHRIYLTWERWEHALGHPGMHEGLLDTLLETLRTGGRRQDQYDPAKFKYRQGFPDLPMSYAHLEVVAKFGWRVASGEVNNFVLTAYLIENW